MLIQNNNFSRSLDYLSLDIRENDAYDEFKDSVSVYDPSLRTFLTSNVFYSLVIQFLEGKDLPNTILISRNWKLVLSSLPEVRDILKFNSHQASVYWKSPVDYYRNPHLQTRIHNTFAIQKRMQQKSNEIQKYNFKIHNDNNGSCWYETKSIFKKLLSLESLIYYSVFSGYIYTLLLTESHISELNDEAENLCESMYNITNCLTDFKNFNVSAFIHDHHLNEQTFLKANDQIYNYLDDISTETQYKYPLFLLVTVSFLGPLYSLIRLRDKAPEFYIENDTYIDRNGEEKRSPTFAMWNGLTIVGCDIFLVPIGVFIASKLDENDGETLTWGLCSVTFCLAANHALNAFKPYYMKRLRDNITEKINNTFQSIGSFFSRIVPRCLRRS